MTVTGIDGDEITFLRETARRFVDKECNQWRALAWDQAGDYPRAVFDEIAAMGWYGIGLDDPEWGSGGALELMVVSEELGRASTDLVACFSLTSSGLRTLVAHGTEEQKAELIPRIMEGTTRLSVAVTEPEAGSDAASLKTRARRERSGDGRSARGSGDRFVVNGQKTFCEAAGLPDTVVQLYVRTDPEARKHRGISMLLLDPTVDGVTLAKLPTLGRRITGVYEIFLDDVELPADRLVGPENGGWKVLVSDLALERLIISAGFVGATFQVLEDTLTHVTGREQFGRPVGSFQGVAHPLVDLFTRAEMARLLIYRGAQLHDLGRPYEKEASMAKIASAELYADATRAAMGMHGGYAYIDEHPLTMHYSDSVIATVAGGPTQVQRNIVAKHLGLPS
jgi:alkylation response protein AidB-like acyl-CoA dehydrogenase